MISAAATAAATAVASSSSSSSTANPGPAALSAAAPPRRLNERKVPDFWEDRPEFWFRIFDAHLAHFSLSEQRCFDALLPLLTPAARSTVHSVIRTPGTTPYTKAREALMRHFGRTPRQLAREMRDTRVLGGRLPSEFLDHLVGLLPDVWKLFEVALLDALPPNARVAALRYTDVYDMARAADEVMLENMASDDAAGPSINQLSLLDGDIDGAHAVPPPMVPQPVSVSAVRRDPKPPQKKTDSLCLIHARYGKEAYKCATPTSCRMRHVTRPRPPLPAQASGNGKAGGQ